MMVVCQSVEVSDKVLFLPLTSMKRKRNKAKPTHTGTFYGECILRKETDMKLIITLLFKLLF